MFDKYISNKIPVLELMFSSDTYLGLRHYDNYDSIATSEVPLSVESLKKESYLQKTHSLVLIFMKNGLKIHK